MYPAPISVSQVGLHGCVCVRSANACLYEQQPARKVKEKGLISEEEKFYSIEQAVSIVVIMARVAVTVAGLATVIF